MPRDYCTWWTGKGYNLKNIHIIAHWTKWCCRNKGVFEEQIFTSQWAVGHILKTWRGHKAIDGSPKDLSHRFRQVEIHYPACFFDGAAQQQHSGCGAWLMISPTYLYKFHWFGGMGTNTRAEVLALWGLLWFFRKLYIDKL